MHFQNIYLLFVNESVHWTAPLQRKRKLEPKYDSTTTIDSSDRKFVHF